MQQYNDFFVDESGFGGLIIEIIERDFCLNCPLSVTNSTEEEGDFLLCHAIIWIAASYPP